MHWAGLVQRNMKVSQVSQLAWQTHNTLSAITYTGPISMFGVAPLKVDSHKRTPRVGGFTSKLTHCCLLAGNGWMETNQRQWRVTHPAHVVLACLQDGVCQMFSMISTSSSHHYSPQLDSSLVKVSRSVSLLMASCCQTVYTRQDCSLSPVCSPEQPKEKWI